MAKENNENPTVTIELSSGMAVGNVFRVVPQEWHEFVLLDTGTIRGLDWSNGIGLICRHVDTVYTAEDVVQTVTLEPYAYGEDGVMGDYPDPGPVPGSGDCYQLDLSQGTEDPNNPGHFVGVLIKVPCPDPYSPPDVPVVPEPDTTPEIITTDDHIDIITPNPVSPIITPIDSSLPPNNYLDADVAPASNCIWTWAAHSIFVSCDGGQTWDSRTPGIDPPNDCNDNPAPTQADVTFVSVISPTIPLNTLYAVGKWQGASGAWRGALYILPRSGPLLDSHGVTF